MRPTFNFSALTALFQATHQEMQHRASRSINVALVMRNWLFGWYITAFEQKGEDRAAYGEQLIEKLAKYLKNKAIKGLSSTNLKQYRSFYLTHRSIGQIVSDELHTPLSISQTVSDLSQKNKITIPQDLFDQLFHSFSMSWSHYVVLLSLNSDKERQFYEIEATQNSWSVRELKRQINSSLYERLSLSRNKAEIQALSTQGLVIDKAADLIKNPFVLEFLDLEERHSYSEHELEAAIISKLETFLLELGKGFLFEARQKRFTFDNDHFYVDLVFYNRLLQCYVLIDLKRETLTHQDLGQMQMYVNYFDRHVKTDKEAPTIGMLLCHQKNDALVELTLPTDSAIYASQYQLYLPSKEELKAKLIEIEKEYGREMEQGVPLNPHIPNQLTD